MPRRLDAVDVAVRESTRLAREPRPRRDGVRATQDDQAVCDWFYDPKPLEYTDPVSYTHLTLPTILLV